MADIRKAAEQALARAEAMLRAPNETLSNAKVLAEVMRQCWLLHGDLSAALAAEQPQPEAQPVAWREHVEQRIRSWRQRTMNRYGDRLAIDDYMSADAIDDLVDYVCDEYAAPPPSAPCPHIRSSGVGDHATHWCALSGPPSAPEPSRTLTQDERDVFDAALARSTKVVVPEPSEAEVEAACAVYDALGPTTDRGLMADALRAAAAARGK